MKSQSSHRTVSHFGYVFKTPSSVYAPGRPSNLLVKRDNDAMWNHNKNTKNSSGKYSTDSISFC